MFSLTFTLRQHTPIIHFQHEQEGATLRATEVKPKLDRFIIQKFGGKENIPEDWFVSEKHLALDYKISFIAKVEQDSYLIASTMPTKEKRELERLEISYLSPAPYFADNESFRKGKWENAELKKGIIYSNISVTITSFNVDLLKKIRGYLSEMLVFENFGTRQSKGFGGFTDSEMTQSMFEKTLNQHPTYKNNIYFRRIANDSDLKDVFKEIDDQYKILKGGDSRGNESKMMRFFRRDKIEWEKVLIKERLIRGEGNRKADDYSQDKANKYIRALLGLAELYEYSQLNIRVKVEHNTQNNEKIERYRSPITVKVFQEKGKYTVYMFAQPVAAEMYNQTFKFALNVNEYILLNTPEMGNFDIHTFMKEALGRTYSLLKA